jgi:Trp operon repressor
MSQYDTETVLKQLLFNLLVAQQEKKGIGTAIRAVSTMLSKEDIAAVEKLANQEIEENRKPS